jgi:hypothetical protein
VCRADRQSSLASSVISALRTLETGQFFSALPAIRAKVASSRFGTLARRVRAISQQSYEWSYDRTSLAVDLRGQWWTITMRFRICVEKDIHDPIIECQSCAAGPFDFSAGREAPWACSAQPRWTRTAKGLRAL